MVKALVKSGIAMLYWVAVNREGTEKGYYVAADSIDLAIETARQQLGPDANIISVSEREEVFVASTYIGESE